MFYIFYFFRRKIMKFNPTKKLLTTLLASAILLSAAACNTSDLEIPLPTSADSTIESTQSEIPTEETTEKTPSDIIFPEGAIKTEIEDRYIEYRIPYDNGTTGFIYYDKDWNAYSLEFTVKTSEIKSVTLLYYDFIDIELISENDVNRHQYCRITYSTKKDAKNYFSKVYENVINCKARFGIKLSYLEHTTDGARIVVVNDPINDTLYEGTDKHKQPTFYPLPDAADVSNPITEIEMAKDIYGSTVAFTVYYKNKEDGISAKTVYFEYAWNGELDEDNPYKSYLQNVLLLNQYENSVTKYKGFAVIDVEPTEHAELILLSDDKITLIDNRGSIYSFTEYYEGARVERVYTDGTFSWVRKHEDGTIENGLSRIIAVEYGYTRFEDLYRSVTKGNNTQFYVQEGYGNYYNPTNERQVTQEKFEAFAKQFGQTEIDWHPITEESINEQFPGECAKVFAPNFNDYDSIIDLCADLMTFLSTYHYVGTPEEDYELKFKFPTEEEYEWFKLLYGRTDAPASILALDYDCLSGYCIKDLNGDGVDELILLSEPWPGEAAFSVLGVFTMKDGRPVMLEGTVDWIDENGFLHDGYFYQEEGYHVIYKVINGGFELVESFGSYKDENGQFNYYRVVNGKKTSITKNEFDKLMKEHQCPVDDRDEAICTYTKGGISFSHYHKNESPRGVEFSSLFKESETLVPTITSGDVWMEEENDYFSLNIITAPDSTVFLGFCQHDKNLISHHFLLQATPFNDGKMSFDNGTLVGMLETDKKGGGTLTITHSTTPLLKVGTYQCHFYVNGNLGGK